MTRKVVKSKGKTRLIYAIVLIVAVVAIVAIVKITNNNENQVREENNTVQNEINEVLNHAVALEDGTKLNTSEELKLVKKYKELEISNIQLTSKNGSSVLLADVKNTGNEEHKSEIVKITILGDNNKIITEIVPVIGTVKPGETIKLNAIVTADVVDAKDIKIEEKK